MSAGTDGTLAVVEVARFQGAQSPSRVHSFIDEVLAVHLPSG